jgi:hypothetical protein
VTVPTTTTTRTTTNNNNNFSLPRPAFASKAGKNLAQMDDQKRREWHVYHYFLIDIHIFVLTQ